jgi:hypothetical protein
VIRKELEKKLKYISENYKNYEKKKTSERERERALERKTNLTK